MSKSEAELCAARLRATMDMYEFGVEMYRQKLRRDDPGASEATIRSRVNAWLRRPPVVEPPLRLVDRLSRGRS